MTDEIKRIYKNISSIYGGQPWYGDNVETYLANVTPAKALTKPEKLNHSIAEIVVHITGWHYFGIEKMKRNVTYEVWDTELNWRIINSLTEVEWRFIKDDLKNSMEQLLQLVEKMPESMLTEIVSGRKYNFRLMLQGIAQHTIYHLGQISLITKLVN